MIRNVFISIILLFILACNPYVQFYETKSRNIEIEGGFYVFENDSLKVTYSFWSEKGTMSFEVYNKLDKPLFIDWKKSSFISNSIKINYYSENENLISSTYTYKGPVKWTGESNHKSLSTSVRVKEERITFIPPNSACLRSELYLLPESTYLMSDSCDSVEQIKFDKSASFIEYKDTFNYQNTPFVFRNFLTLSLSEDFNNEFYLDNEFFISEIKEVPFVEAKRYAIDKNGKYLRTNEGKAYFIFRYKSNTMFYKFIPAYLSKENRK